MLSDERFGALADKVGSVFQSKFHEFANRKVRVFSSRKECLFPRAQCLYEHLGVTISNAVRVEGIAKVCSRQKLRHVRFFDKSIPRCIVGLRISKGSYVRSNCDLSKQLREKPGLIDTVCRNVKEIGRRVIHGVTGQGARKANFTGLIREGLTRSVDGHTRTAKEGCGFLSAHETRQQIRELGTIGG